MGLKPTTTGMGGYLRILNKIKIPFSGHNATGLGDPGGGQVGLKPTTTGMGRYLRILNKIKIPFSGHKHDWAGRPGQRPGGIETHHYGDGQIPAHPE